MDRNWTFPWGESHCLLVLLGITTSLSGLISQKVLQGYHKPEGMTTMLEPACPQLEQLLPNSSVEATCKTPFLFHTSGSRMFWRALGEKTAGKWCIRLHLATGGVKSGFASQKQKTLEPTPLLGCHWWITTQMTGRTPGTQHGGSLCLEKKLGQANS